MLPRIKSYIIKNFFFALVLICYVKLMDRLICFNNVISQVCAKNFSLMGGTDPEAI